MSPYFSGNKGLRWSYLLNVPYVVIPYYAAVKFIREGLNVKHKSEVSFRLVQITKIWDLFE